MSLNLRDVLAYIDTAEATEVELRLTLTPTLLADVQREAISLEHPKCALVLSIRAWASIASDPVLQHLFDPETKQVSISAGRLGVLFGMELLTDAYNDPNSRVLAEDDLYAVSYVTDGDDEAVFHKLIRLKVR